MSVTLGIMKRRDIEQIIRMAAWLHLVTVVFLISKWTGFLHVSWIMVFLPSLLYGTFIIVVVGGCTILNNPVSRHRVSAMASSSQRS
jgi:hypothetical protein